MEGALAFVEERPGLEAIIIDDHDEVHVTSGLVDSVRLIAKPAPESK